MLRIKSHLTTLANWFSFSLLVLVAVFFLSLCFFVVCGSRYKLLEAVVFSPYTELSRPLSLPTIAEHHCNICQRAFKNIVSDDQHKLKEAFAASIFHTIQPKARAQL